MDFAACTFSDRIITGNISRGNTSLVLEFLDSSVHSQFVTLCTKPNDTADSNVGKVRMVSVLFSGIEIGKVNFDDRSIYKA